MIIIKIRNVVIIVIMMHYVKIKSFIILIIKNVEFIAIINFSIIAIVRNANFNINMSQFILFKNH